jgi:hypothetical protein
VGGRRRVEKVWEGEYSANIVYLCIDTQYGKMSLVETIPGKGRERKRRMREGVNLTMIYYKNFCKCHSVPSPSTTTIKNGVIISRCCLKKTAGFGDVLGTIKSYYRNTACEALLMKKENKDIQSPECILKMAPEKQKKISWKSHREVTI